jgi:iron complex transport system substrate-binding protein
MSRTWETLGLLSAKHRRKRLISTSPDNTEIICALGGVDDLVGVSKHCDFPEGIRDLKPVISDFASVEVDKVLTLNPDVVFCSTYYQGEIIKTLVENHVRVFVTQPSSLASIYDNISLIANLIGRPEKGDMLIERMQHGFSQQEPRDLKVFAEEWGEPIVHAAPWIHEMVALAGGTPVLLELNASTHTNGRIVSPAQVVETRADVVLLPWCGVHGKAPVDKVKSRPGWEALPAVQKNQVFPVEDSLFVRPGPRLVDGYRLLITLFESCN